MPHNNPDKDLTDGSNTVFIDASALGELSTQLTQQDLETLVGLNIHAAEFEALQEEIPESQVVDSSGVLISDGVAVGNFVEVAGAEARVGDDGSRSQDQPMDVDPLSEQAHVIEDMEMLQQGSDLITMGGEELTATTDTTTAALLTTASSGSSDSSSSQLVSEAPQIIKSNLGQFVVLQQNQNSISLGSLSNRLVTSGGQITTMAGFGNSGSSSKQVVVNTSQLGTSLRSQPLMVTQPLVQTQQVRTVQLKQAQQTQSQNSGTVTKVIITSQAGGVSSLGGQQLRLVTSQSSGSTQVSASPTKLTLQQAQQMGIVGLSPLKPAVQSPNKIVVQRVGMGASSPVKSPTKVMLPVPLGVKSPTKIAPAPPSGQPQIITHQIGSSGAVRNILSSPQKIVIKSNVPQPGQGMVSTVRAGQIVTSGGQQVIKIPANQVHQLTGQTPNVQVISNKMNYVRLVNPGVGGGGGGGGGGTTLLKQAPQVNKPIAPASSQPIKIKAMPIAPNQQSNKQRVIIPVSGSNVSGGVPLRSPSTSLTLPASALPPGVLSNTQPGSVVMIPAHYMSQLQQSSQTTPTTVQVSSQAPPGTIIPQPPKPQPPRNLIDANGIRPRKPCNCTKSQCLKLYCDCFANGEFCNNCNCANCFNNLSHEVDRQKAIKACLDRNPQAFRPKIGKGGNDNERRHNKGCNCKRSGCLKNYCECYEAKIPCSSICRCVGCKNVDVNPAVERKGLMQLAECAEARVNQQNAVKSKLPSLSHHSPFKVFLPASSKAGYCRMNQEVVEATCQCLLAQADKAQNALDSEAEIELRVISEFSRCLMQIIGSYTSRSRGLGDS